MFLPIAIATDVVYYNNAKHTIGKHGRNSSQANQAIFIYPVVILGMFIYSWLWDHNRGQSKC